MSVSSLTDSLVIVGDEMIKSNESTKVEPHLPEMKSMHVVSNVRNRYARTVVTSKYTNLNKSTQQATFTIVLPDTAFIACFVMEIEGKKYEAYVKEKEEAKQVYQEAVRSGQAAAHVAVSARDSNKFTVSVNVEPQGDVIFILTYEELLVRKHSKYEMVVNMQPGQFIDDLEVDVHINETRPIIHVETPAVRSGNEITDQVAKNEHAIVTQDDDGVVHVSFHLNVEQQKEIAKALAKTNTNEQLSHENNSNEFSGQFVVEYDVERDPLGGEILVNDGYFVHFFAPSDLKPIPKHVIFVLDVSGSMGGTKLKQLKEAMKVILNELNPEDYFNLVKFSDDISVLNSKYTWNTIDIPAESMLPESFAVNAKNIKSVQNVVDHISDVGMTNIYDALIVGLRMTSKRISHSEKIKNKHRPQPMIVFLTDGQPNVSESDPKKIIETVENRNDCDNKCAVFTLAFGDDADNEFLKELAVKNSGFLRNIYEAADASLQLQDFYKQISSPLLTNVNFKYSEDVKEVSKHTFDILFDGSEFVVAGKVDDMVDDFVLVEGNTLDGINKFCPTIISFCPKPDEKTKYGNLERLWAYMTIKQLLDKKYETKATENETSKIPKEKEAAERQALKLALKYSFVTSVTSLVVVKPDESTVEGKLQDCNETKNFNDDDIYMDHHMMNACMKAGPDTCKSLHYCSHSRFSFRLPSLSLSPLKKIRCAFKTAKRDKFNRFFTKSKDDNQELHFMVKNIQVYCNVETHVVRTQEIRKYMNLDNKSHETTFTIVFPENTFGVESDMYIDEQKFVANGQEETQAKKEYAEAVSKGVTAFLVNLQDSNKVTTTVHIEPKSKVTFCLNYKNRLEMKNGKYEIVINLDREALAADVYLQGSLPIKNIVTPILRNKYGAIKNKYVTINKDVIGAHIAFKPTLEDEVEIIAALKDTDNQFAAQFIVEYEIEGNPSTTENLGTSDPVATPFSYLIAVQKTIPDVN